MTRLEKVYQFAIKAHSGQKRNNGEAYVNHSIRISNRLLNNNEKIVALLHDVFEDNPNLDFDISCKELNLGVDEIEALTVLTRKKHQTYLNYIRNIPVSSLATKVKIEDLKDNLSDLVEGSQRDKYELALYLLQV